MTSIRLSLKTLVVATALVVAGCEAADLASVINSSTDFGDDYAVVRHATSPQAPPRLSASHLEVLVRYGGGCARHEFALHWRRQGDTTELWLYHDANGDLCEALLTEQLRVFVSPVVLETEHVVLLTPGGPPIPLR